MAKMNPFAKPKASGMYGTRAPSAPAKVPVAGLNTTRAALKGQRAATMPKGMMSKSKKGC